MVLEKKCLFSVLSASGVCSIFITLPLLHCSDYMLSSLSKTMSCVEGGEGKLLCVIMCFCCSFPFFRCCLCMLSCGIWIYDSYHGKVPLILLFYLFYFTFNLGFNVFLPFFLNLVSFCFVFSVFSFVKTNKQTKQTNLPF